jgi:hypothetical protein
MGGIFGKAAQIQVFFATGSPGAKCGKKRAAKRPSSCKLAQKLNTVDGDDVMSSHYQSRATCSESIISESAAPIADSRADLVSEMIVSRLSRILGGRRRTGGGRETAYRPTGESLESKTLLSDVLGWSGGNAGNTSSTITPANISKLKQQYSHTLDALILASPVTATVDVTVGPDQGTQDVVFVATEVDTLYAFNVASGQLLWRKSLLGPGETPIPQPATTTDWGGVTGTPVIDPATNTIYLVTTESHVSGNVTYYSKTLRALDMSTGTEQPGSPAVIADTGYNSHGKAVSFMGPSVAGSGAGSVNGRVYFYVNRQLQRPGLSLVGNNVVIAFGAYGDDVPPEHGWILTYNKTSLKATGVFNDTPDGADGGIWNDGNPIQADSKGYLYTETGNGTFDTKLNSAGLPNRGDYGDSVLKLKFDPGYTGPNGYGLRVVDYFTPSNQAYLDKYDGDLASSGVLVLPDGSGGKQHPNLLLASNKAGTIFVINRSDMGHFDPKSNKDVQTLNGAITSSFDTPTLLNNKVYYIGTNDHLKSFSLAKGHLAQSGQSPNVIPWPGASPVFSSDGAKNGILWVVSPGDELIAYNATNLSKVLWSAALPNYSTFSVPAVASDGHVEVIANDNLIGFGLAGKG